MKTIKEYTSVVNSVEYNEIKSKVASDKVEVKSESQGLLPDNRDNIDISSPTQGLS